MWLAHAELLKVIFIGSLVFNGVLGDLGSHFETIIPAKLKNLPSKFEAKKKSAVYKCPKEVNAAVYGISTAFHQNGIVKCDVDISITHLKFIKCEIPLKIQWLRARSLDGTGDEVFFSTFTGSIYHHIGLGIEEMGFKKLLSQLTMDGGASNPMDKVDSVKRKALIKCVADGLTELNEMFSSLLLR